MGRRFREAEEGKGLLFSRRQTMNRRRPVYNSSQVCTEVAKGGYGRKAVVVRINSLDSPWGEEDIRSVARLTLDAVVIPKVQL